MPLVTIKTGEGDRHIEFCPGQSLREILDSTSFRVRSGCRGTGACGLCRVNVRTNDPAGPSLIERVYLSEDQIASGVRLACQIKPEQDIEVTVLNREPVSSWRAMPGASRRFTRLASELPRSPGSAYGAAVDIGTTHISVSFYDLSTGEWFAGRHGLNPQACFGADVVTRLIAYNESREAARTLRGLIIDAIGSAAMDMAVREGIGLEQVVKVTLVGNTAMLAVFSGRNCDLLLQPAYWMAPIGCVPENPRELSATWGIHPEAIIEVVQPLAGFVGSDLLAGAVGTKLVEEEPGALLIDFGTNSEIALWDGESLWVTSAAGGPAFEGCGISCGIPGGPGAISQVREHPGGAGPPGGACPNFEEVIFWNKLACFDLEFRTIDDERPIGLCGSGIVDLIACLVRSGQLTSIGRFSPEVPQGGIILLNGDRQQLRLTKKDVDIFQRAKAAIFAGVQVMLSMAKLTPGQLRRVYIGGAFGHFLNRENARQIGLLPDLESNAIELCGNIALRGCEELLMSEDSGKTLNKIKSKTRLINMAQCAEFDDFFMEGLYLGRWSDCNRRW